MIGNTYKMVGTDTVFEITGEGKSYWIVNVRSAKGEELAVRMGKSALEDDIKAKKLEKLQEADAFDDALHIGGLHDVIPGV
jgi:hypothetical protein